MLRVAGFAKGSRGAGVAHEALGHSVNTGGEQLSMRGCVSVSLAAFRNTRDGGGIDNRHFLLPHFQSLESPKARSQQIQFLVRVLPGLHLAVFSQVGEKAR